MTVYVDNARHRYRGMIMCHMIADDEAELHAIAARLGLRRAWYQADHYDIARSKRDLALEYGAVAVTERQMEAMRSNYRHCGTLGDPKTAEDVMRARLAARREQKQQSEGLR